MAAVTFSGTTLASDSSTSNDYYLFGQVQDAYFHPVTRWMEEPVTRGNGIIMKNLGSDPGGAQVAFTIMVAASNVDNYRGVIEGLRGTSGTVATPRDSLTNCVLTSANVQNMGTARDASGSLRAVLGVGLTFRRLKV